MMYYQSQDPRTGSAIPGQDEAGLEVAGKFFRCRPVQVALLVIAAAPRK